VVTTGNGRKYSKEFLKGCSLAGIVCRTCKHDFIHFGWTCSWFDQQLTILALDGILDDVRHVSVWLFLYEGEDVLNTHSLIVARLIYFRAASIYI